MDSNYTLQTVERAISFLEYVAAAPGAPHIRDVSKALDLNITTSYHLLRTLMARNYIARNEDGGLQLGQGVEALTRGYNRGQNIEQRLSEVVRQLAGQTFETAYLSLREGDQVILKVLVEGSQRLRVAGLSVGMKGNEYRRASGKAVLANLDSAAREAMLEGSVADLPDLQRKAVLKGLDKELAQTAARGWSVDNGQSEHGIVSIAAPVFDQSDQVFGAVGIIGPVFRIEKSNDIFRDAVLAAGAEASRILKTWNG